MAFFCYCALERPRLAAVGWQPWFCIRIAGNGGSGPPCSLSKLQSVTTGMFYQHWIGDKNMAPGTVFENSGVVVIPASDGMCETLAGFHPDWSRLKSTDYPALQPFFFTRLENRCRWLAPCGDTPCPPLRFLGRSGLVSDFVRSTCCRLSQDVHER